MSITGEQLKEIAYRKRITSWTADNCAVCDYPIKYTFGEKVEHDPGCHCSDMETYRAIRFQTSSWGLVANWINDQTDLEKVKQIKKFWEI